MEERAGPTRVADEETEPKAEPVSIGGDGRHWRWKSSMKRRETQKKTHLNAPNSSTNSTWRFCSFKSAFSSLKPEEELMAVKTVPDLLLEGQRLREEDADYSASSR